VGPCLSHVPHLISIIKGIFQLPLLASILGTHIWSISDINPLLRSEKRPVGALIHSIQAVRSHPFLSICPLRGLMFRVFRLSEQSAGGRLASKFGHAVPIATTRRPIGATTWKPRKEEWCDLQPCPPRLTAEGEAVEDDPRSSYLPRLRRRGKKLSHHIWQPQLNPNLNCSLWTTIATQARF